MNQFYVSMIFIGIVLISVSLIMIMLEKKKAFSFINNYEKKKQELVEIIYDAEQMIEELNKFSDYVVTQMDFKNEELTLNLKKAQKEIQTLTQGLQIKNCRAGDINFTGEPGIIEKLEPENNIPVRQELSKNGNLNKPAVNNEPIFRLGKDIEIENWNLEKPETNTGLNKIVKTQNENIKNENIKNENIKNENIQNEKVVPVNNKYSEVVRLFKAGMDNVDIAKRLNMGKGEVQLILELNK